NDFVEQGDRFCRGARRIGQRFVEAREPGDGFGPGPHRPRVETRQVCASSPSSVVQQVVHAHLLQDDVPELSQFGSNVPGSNSSPDSNATPLSERSFCKSPFLKASKTSAAPPTNWPPTKICGIVIEPVRAATAARIFPPRSSFWFSTESMSMDRYAMPPFLNSLRTDQQNSHHSNANITTGSVRSARRLRTNSST